MSMSNSWGDLEHAIDLNPDYAWAYWLRAQIFADVGRYHDALGTSAKATHYDDEKNTVPFDADPFDDGERKP